MTTMSNDYSKENYLVYSNDMNHWRNHPNYFIINDSLSYLKGHCADVGCNIGILSVHLSEIDAVTQITGFDINDKAIEEAQKASKEHLFNERADFHCLNLVTDDTTSFNNMFDSMISFHTLEHIYTDDADMFIAKQYDMLKAGAYCLIVLPYEHAYPDACHVAFYNEVSLKSLYEKRGFITEKCFKDDRWRETDLLHGVFQKPLD